jgi:hypothetical protein
MDFRSLRVACRSFLIAGAVVAAGCGEKEAAVIPSDKPRAELQKEMENPYDAAVASPKTKQADTTGKD